MRTGISVHFLTRAGTELMYSRQYYTQILTIQVMLLLGLLRLTYFSFVNVTFLPSKSVN